MIGTKNQTMHFIFNIHIKNYVVYLLHILTVVHFFLMFFILFKFVVFSKFYFFPISFGFLFWSVFFSYVFFSQNCCFSLKKSTADAFSLKTHHSCRYLWVFCIKKLRGQFLIISNHRKFEAIFETVRHFRDLFGRLTYYPSVRIFFVILPGDTFFFDFYFQKTFVDRQLPQSSRTDQNRTSDRSDW